MDATRTESLLRRVPIENLSRAVRPPVDERTLDAARRIVHRVRDHGEDAVRSLAEQFSERQTGEPLVLGTDEMAAALAAFPRETRELLERSAQRIGAFAQAQLEAIRPIDVPVPGGRAGHTVEPVSSAGCYAPAGRYPLPSSVLMTAVTARAAGCDRVVVASPGAHPLSVAAAAVAGADQFLAVGGAHAVAAMAYGIDGLAACDVIAGPGNRWVTAAKQIVSGVAGIDMLAGPSELLVIADDSADPAVVAADLLGQAEHDADAVPMLVTTSDNLATEVCSELARQVDSLSTNATAREALQNGFVCVVGTADQARAAADTIAAEHVEIMTRDADRFAHSLRNAGALFIGPASAEVIGDYGAGPNHTLPTGGTARFRAGLSVASFLRLRTWIRIEDVRGADELIGDTIRLAELEGLAAHAASAARRRKQ
ncbi:MAG: histidinol dehydrogenase [Planctomycetota bacterium]